MVHKDSIIFSDRLNDCLVFFLLLICFFVLSEIRTRSKERGFRNVYEEKSQTWPSTADGFGGNPKSEQRSPNMWDFRILP